MRKLMGFLLLACWQVCLYAGNYEVVSPDGGSSDGFRWIRNGGFL